MTYNITSQIFGSGYNYIQQEPVTSTVTLVAIGALGALKYATKGCLCGRAKARFMQNLNEWCDEKIGTLEHAKRVEAAKRICAALSCWRPMILNLSQLQLTSIPSCIGQLVNLQTLNLSENQLTGLPSEIGQLTKLRELNLFANWFRILPFEICQLTNLQKLDLTSNPIRALPPEIGQLINLESLCTHNNQLTDLPSEIGQLANLKTLNLSENELTALPSEIGQLANLKELYIFNNQFRDWPPEIWQLINLRTLSASNNQFTDLPAQIKLLIKLRELCLNTNQLQDLPSEIGQLVNLKFLNVSNNQFRALSPEIGQLVNLQELNASSNQLRAVPSEIGQLVNLQKFDVSRNRLIALPSEIGRLANLKVLYVDHNQLTGLPSFLAQLHSRANIWAESNLFSPLAIEQFQHAIQAARALDQTRGPNFSISIHDQQDAAFSTLEEGLRFWLQRVKEAWPEERREALLKERDERDFHTFYAPLLSHPGSNILRKFLGGVRRVQDFQNNPRGFAIRMDQVLDNACLYPHFREKFFAILEDANETCGDRDAMCFTQIEMQQKLLSAAPKTLNELADVLIGLERSYLLIESGKKLIEELRLGDHIETLLYLQIELKDQLKLPHSTETMLYRGMAGLNGEHVRRARKEVLAETGSINQQIDLLLKSEIWMERIKKEHPTFFATINEEFEKELDSLSPNLTEFAQKAAEIEITSKRRDKIRHLTRNYTNRSNG